MLLAVKVVASHNWLCWKHKEMASKEQDEAVSHKKYKTKTLRQSSPLKIAYEFV